MLRNKTKDVDINLYVKVTTNLINWDDKTLASDPLRAVPIFWCYAWCYMLFIEIFFFKLNARSNERKWKRANWCVSEPAATVRWLRIILKFNQEKKGETAFNRLCQQMKQLPNCSLLTYLHSLTSHMGNIFEH